MEIIKDVKGREIAAKIGATVNEEAEIYQVSKKWAGRVSTTVPMNLKEATERFESFSSHKNHGVWVTETITIGALI